MPGHAWHDNSYSSKEYTRNNCGNNIYLTIGCLIFSALCIFFLLLSNMFYFVFIGAFLSIQPVNIFIKTLYPFLISCAYGM